MVDVIVVGGGIAGAGIFREIARAGLRVLLLEQQDFASGTSSRSSKLLHGGLHYLSRLQVGLAWRASADRNRLVRAGAGLVEPLEFFLPRGHTPGTPTWALRPLLEVYRRLGRPGGPSPGRRGGVSSPDPRLGRGFRYDDAAVDDAGLVLRVLREGRDRGGRAANYVRVTGLLRDEEGRVRGVALRGERAGAGSERRARLVVNATGIWADGLRAAVGRPPRITLLRGSHLVLSRRALPLRRAVAGIHPRTRRPVYAVPWAGTSLVGSTAVVHDEPVDGEPHITSGEFLHLLEWVRAVFPGRALGPEHVRATFSGVRPLVDASACDARHASRGVRIEASAPGLLSVMGGKLTTFHSTARAVTRRVTRLLGDRCPPGSPPLDSVAPVWGPGPVPRGEVARIVGRYGPDALEWMASRPAPELCPLSGLGVSAAELRWACLHEDVRHLDDLLLRRTRVGITRPQAVGAILDELPSLVGDALGWSGGRWSAERERFRECLRTGYGIPIHRSNHAAVAR